MLRQELRHKGVADETAQAALEQIDSEGERERARQLVERKLAGRHVAVPEREAARLVGMLVRRGYPSGTAYSVVRDVLAASELPESIDES